MQFPNSWISQQDQMSWEDSVINLKENSCKSIKTLQEMASEVMSDLEIMSNNLKVMRSRLSFLHNQIDQRLGNHVFTHH